MSSRQYVACMLCGGKGTRLLSLTNDLVPKSLVEVRGKKLIQFSLEMLHLAPISQAVFALDHHGVALRHWVDEQHFVFPVRFSEQSHSGVLPALQAASTFMAGNGIIACNTDEIRLHLHLQPAIDFHETHGRLATMVVTTSRNLANHRVVDVADDGLIRSSALKDKRYLEHPEASGLVNVGVLIFEPQAFTYLNPSLSSDWSGIIDPLIAAGQLYAYVDTNIVYFNVGTVSEYQEAVRFLEQQT